MAGGFRSPLAWWVGGGAAVPSSGAVPGFRSPAAIWMGGASAVPSGGGTEHAGFASPLAWWMGGASAVPSTEPPEGGTRSPWNRPFRGVQYRRWFYSNWLPQPAADLPQSPIRVVRGRIAPGDGHPGALRPPTHRHRPPRGEPTLDRVGGRSDRQIARAPWGNVADRGPEHTTADEDIEAILVALLLLDEDED